MSAEPVSTPGSPFDAHLGARGFVVLDGGLATALERRGHDLRDELWSARLLLDAPEEIVAVHAAYLEAGADCITTAAYQATVPGFERRGASRDEALAALRRSTELARRAVEDRGRDHDGPPALVAASIGPYGAALADGSEYDGRYTITDERLRAFHEERLDVLAGAGSDLFACETIPSGREALILLDLLDTLPDAHAWLSFSCADGERLWDGTPVEEMAAACAGHRAVAAVGINCTAPRFAGELAERIGSASGRPVVVYPNSGERWDGVAKRWLEDGRPGAVSWMDGLEAAWRAGARILGGCCRTGPAEIAELRERLARGDWSA